MLRATWSSLIATAVFAVAACGPAASRPDIRTAESITPEVTRPPVIAEAPTPTPHTAPITPDSPPAATTSPETRTDMPVRVDLRTTDEATAGFAEEVLAILTDPRGWGRAGFQFREDPDAPYTIVLAEGDEVDRLCLPYDTYGLYSCQNGPVVALNADRWRSATPQWPADLASYRVMLVNHEVGHLLHLHHPRPPCPAPGLPAPIMAQQSTTLEGCAPNPWPLQWEIDLAAARLEPLAPGADHDPADHRPVPPPVDR